MKCKKCNTREATENWVGEGSMLDYVHGNYQRWCKRCCLEASIEYAERHKDDLKRLKKELKLLTHEPTQVKAKEKNIC